MQRTRWSLAAPRHCAFALLLLWSLAPSVMAQSVAQALAERSAEHAAARATQAAIDALQGRGDGPARSAEDRALDARVAQAGELAAAAEAERAELAVQLARRREAQAGVVPLLHEMLDLLEQSIAADLPFDLAQRSAQLGAARAALTRHGLALADRFDAVVGAYRAELAYGYTSATGRTTLAPGGVTRLVSTLRIGRIALYYVTDDDAHCGVYRRDTGDYVPLARAQCAVIRAALDGPDHAAALPRLPLSVPAP